jgi:hypothetical protein
MNSTAQHAEAIDAFAPQTRQITAGGKTHEVKRLETRQIWPILRCGLPFIEGLATFAAPASSPAVEPPPGSSPQAGQPLDPLPITSALDRLVGPEIGFFLRLMAEHGERINEMVATALDIKVSEVGRFEPQETYLAAKAIVEVNRDFFSHRVLPMLGVDPGRVAPGALVSAMGRALGSNGVGPTPSSS